MKLKGHKTMKPKMSQLEEMMRHSREMPTPGMGGMDMGAMMEQPPEPGNDDLMREFSDTQQRGMANQGEMMEKIRKFIEYLKAMPAQQR